MHIPQAATDEEIKRVYEAAVEKIEATLERLQQPLPTSIMAGGAIPADPELGEIFFQFDQGAVYLSNVDQAKEYIRAGDIFQVVLSQRFNIETEVDPFMCIGYCVR